MDDYVNQTDAEAAGSREANKEETPYTGRRLFGLVAVCFGLLCVFQATLNISLRLIGYSNGERGVVACNDTLTKPGGCVPGQVCLPGWSSLGCRCYYVSTELKTWEESRQDCHQRGAHLVVINTREEQEFLSTFNKRAWIGLSDRDVEGTWTWVDGTPLTTAYWKRGQPDNAGGTTEEDCALIYSYNLDPVNSWFDAVCGLRSNWICERGI